MKVQKNIFSIVLLASFFLQLLVPLHHAFEKHDSIEICAANDIEHICNHNFEDSQEFLDIKVEYASTYVYNSITTPEVTSYVFHKVDYIKNSQKLPYSLRAPPSKNII